MSVFSVNTAVEDSPYKVDTVDVPAVSIFIYLFIIIV